MLALRPICIIGQPVAAGAEFKVSGAEAALLAAGGRARLFDEADLQSVRQALTTENARVCRPLAAEWPRARIGGL